MKNKWPFIFLFLLASCNSGKQEKEVSTVAPGKDSSVKNNTPVTPAGRVAHNFWDSISMQLKLTGDQMAKYTNVDSFYYRIDSNYLQYTENFGFFGDTLYTSGNLKIAILHRGSLNCLEEFLFVFDSSGTNSSYVIIGEGCDRDGESEYSMLEYEILTDLTFKTISTHMPENADENDKNVTREIIRWKIDRNGRIDSIPQVKKRRNASKP